MPTFSIHVNGNRHQVDASADTPLLWVLRDEGNAAGILGDASRVVEATYEIPFLAHATMEPMNCTIHVKKDSCEIWCRARTRSRCSGWSRSIWAYRKRR